MIYSCRKTISYIFLVALLSACGGQSVTDTASSLAAKALLSTQSTQITSISTSPSSLLASIAVTYPNGQLPASSAAQAANELTQNPAVLKLAAQLTTSATINRQSTADHIRVQVNDAAFVPVTRIQNTTLTGAYFFTANDEERVNALANNPNWKQEGTAFFVSNILDSTVSSVHRFRNKINGSYLYTIYESEKVSIITNYASTFVYEGVAWYARQTPAAAYYPLYRFRNVLNGTYLFTAYELEKTSIEANYSAVFQLEGVAYYVKQRNGFDLIPNATGGVYDKTECVRDYSTGLVWQGQTPKGTGLRANNHYKTNFDSLTELQQIDYANYPNLSYRASTQAEIDSINNSIGFKNAVNASNLCGLHGWRVPTSEELEKLAGMPIAAYHTWFPNHPLIDYSYNCVPGAGNICPFQPGSYWSSSRSYVKASEGMAVELNGPNCAPYCNPNLYAYSTRRDVNSFLHQIVVRLVHD